MITTRIAINGLGRIGRAFLKIALERPELELVAVNDISDPENIAYLIKHDSVYRRYPRPVSVDRRPDGTWLVVGDQRMWFLQHKDPAELPWETMATDRSEADVVWGPPDIGGVYQDPAHNSGLKISAGPQGPTVYDGWFSDKLEIKAPTDQDAIVLATPWDYPPLFDGTARPYADTAAFGDNCCSSFRVALVPKPTIC